ncbi:MAG: protein NrnU, partial [Proteobacteria bacterium]|nr:protein NrnU [Pseudomonadota bacterium]
LAPLLVLVAFVLAAAAVVPGTRLTARLHHPFVLAVKTWAFAHLIATGTLADFVLFASFLAWAIVDFASLRRRDRAAGTVYPPGRLSRDALAVGVGVAAWLVVGLWLHPLLIGVNPFR